jgi:branched-chain amino acid transport system substrate-binding protein
VAAFTDSFKAGGGQIVFASTVNPEDKDFSAVVSKVKGASPDAVYFGGEYPVAGPFSQQAKAAGLTVPLMGGDGMQAAGYLELAGKSSEGDLGTSVGAPPEELPSAKQFIADYKAGGFKEAYGPYGALSYDATNAIINGMKTSLTSAEDGKAARAATIDAIQKGTIDGATGPVAFDEFGDTKTKILTVWKVEKGAWVAIKSGT